MKVELTQNLVAQLLDTPVDDITRRLSETLVIRDIELSSTSPAKDQSAAVREFLRAFSIEGDDLKLLKELLSNKPPVNEKAPQVSLRSVETSNPEVVIDDEVVELSRSKIVQFLKEQLQRLPNIEELFRKIERRANAEQPLELVRDVARDLNSILEKNVALKARGFSEFIDAFQKSLPTLDYSKMSGQDLQKLLGGFLEGLREQVRSAQAELTPKQLESTRVLEEQLKELIRRGTSFSEEVPKELLKSLETIPLKVVERDVEFLEKIERLVQGFTKSLEQLATSSEKPAKQLASVEKLLNSLREQLNVIVEKEAAPSPEIQKLVIELKEHLDKAAKEISKKPLPLDLREAEVLAKDIASRRTNVVSQLLTAVKGFGERAAEVLQLTDRKVSQLAERQLDFLKGKEAKLIKLLDAPELKPVEPKPVSVSRDALAQLIEVSSGTEQKLRVAAESRRAVLNLVENLQKALVEFSSQPVEKASRQEVALRETLQLALRETVRVLEQKAPEVIDRSTREQLTKLKQQLERATTEQSKGVDELQASLQKIALTTQQAPEQKVERELLSFIKTLQARIPEVARENVAQSEKLDALKELLSELHRRFSKAEPQKGENLLQRALELRAEIPKRFQTDLKTIDVQLKNLIANPELLQAQKPAAEAPKQIAAEIVRAIENFEKASAPPRTPEEQVVRDLLKQFASQLQELGARQPARSEFNARAQELITQLAERLAQLSGMSLPAQGGVSAPLIRALNLPDYLQEFLQQLGQQLKNVGSSDTSAAAPDIAKQASKALVQAFVQQVLQLVSEQSIGLDAATLPANAAQRFVEGLRAQVDKLRDAAPRTEIVRDALEQLRDVAIQPQSAAEYNRSQAAALMSHASRPAVSMPKAFAELIQSEVARMLQNYSSAKSIEGLRLADVIRNGALQPQAAANVLSAAMPQMPGGTNGVPNELSEQLMAMLQTFETSSAKGGRTVERQVSELARELRSVLEQDKGELRPKLQQALDFIRESAPSAQNSPTDLGRMQRDLQTLRGVENLLRGQEMLNRMNPVMQALGEPALLLFPAFMQGLFAKIELAFYPHAMRGREQKDLKQESKSRKAPKEQPEDRGQHESEDEQQPPPQQNPRMRFSVPLPNLGDVEVDFLPTDAGLMLKINCETREAASFLEQQIDGLRPALEALGFKDLNFEISAKPMRGVRPKWVSEVFQSKVVSA